ncbi:MAG: hypothetical protein KR126chlam5_01025 [Candidatus Anoxychlamydiales bacterium]|nr:hypothetical protein [Candidatus Anoxychlamydiales bacterium]NGX52722.1 hypothetical protein [Candidatus Anoxychlamydiales bacterium]
MRYLFLLLLLFFFNSCNLENGVQKNYIISQVKDTEDTTDEAKN